MTIKISITLLYVGFLLGFSRVEAQQTKNILFIGNSYTYGNDLPQMIKNAALSTGDVVNFDMNAPGGYTFSQHTSNATTLSKIAAGTWDYVVLQEQSQWPSFPDGQVAQGMFPYAKKLDSLVNAKNPCAETIFYMTWGRKNGDAQNCGGWAPVCTYRGMDSLISLRYVQMATDNNALLSPVGKVWRALRQQFPTIELYQADESHPSIWGSYAAACTFYSVIFRKDPTLITWNSSLNSIEAIQIKNVVKSVVYDVLSTYHVGAYDPVADFIFQPTGQQINFQNTSENATSFTWDFGDGSISSESNPVHHFNGNGPFQVKLVASHCGISDTIIKTFEVAGIEKLQKETLHIYPNPASDFLMVEIIHSSQMKNMMVKDVNGRIILMFTTGDVNTIDISKLETGTYFLQAEFENGIVVERFVID